MQVLHGIGNGGILNASAAVVVGHTIIFFSMFSAGYAVAVAAATRAVSLVAAAVWARITI